MGIESLERRDLMASATFVGADAATQGRWAGSYGSDGYQVIGGGVSLPSYVAVTPAGASSWTWAASTTDPRAPQAAPGSSAGVAACWYSPSSFSVGVNLTDGKTHQMGVDVLDWDGLGRSERIDVIDAASGKLLDSETVSSFAGGKYLTWTVGGNVVLKFTGLAGPNAVLSGLFFGASGSSGIGAPMASISGAPASDPAGTPVNLVGSVTNSSSTAGFTYFWSVTKNGGAFATGAGSNFTFTPDDMGTFIASLVVTDAKGIWSIPATATVGVTNVAPTAQAGGPYSITAGSKLSFSGSASDPAAAVTAAGFTYTWNFGDSSQGSGPNPSHTYTSPGTYHVGLSVIDKNGGVGTAAAVVAVLAAPVKAPAPQEPLLHQADLHYVGAFRTPSYYDATDEMSYGGTALAFNPGNKSLFIVGHHQSIENISIPQSIVNSSKLDSLATATVLQPWTNVLAGLSSPLVGASDGALIGGLIEDSGQLIGTQYAYYSGANGQTTSHFVLNSLNLPTAGISGLYQVGDGGAGARSIAGYMASIPSEWQGSLGAPFLTGQSDIPIYSTTSNGPTAFGFDPSTLATGNAQAIPYSYYPVNAPLGAYQGPANPMQSGTTQIGGVVFPEGSGSVLFFGRSGTNYEGYGLASTFGDNNDGGKGPHSLNGEYSFQIWAYRASDFADVKAGTKQPGQVVPYDVWNLSFPIDTGEHTVGGVAYDPSTGRVYVSLMNADHEIPYSSLPLIEVFQVSLPSGVQSPAAPQVGTMAATPSTLVPGAIPAGTPTTLTAGNVYALNQGATIAKVSFYLIADGGTTPNGSDKLLGQGSGTGNLPDGSNSNWALTIDTNGIAPGTYTVFAQATDSNGQVSNVTGTTMIISLNTASPLIGSNAASPLVIGSAATTKAIPAVSSTDLIAEGIQALSMEDTISEVSQGLIAGVGITPGGINPPSGQDSVIKQQGGVSGWAPKIVATRMSRGKPNIYVQAADAEILRAG